MFVVKRLFQEIEEDLPILTRRARKVIPNRNRIEKGFAPKKLLSMAMASFRNPSNKEIFEPTFKLVNLHNRRLELPL